MDNQNLPNLTYKDYVTLDKLRSRFPVQFYRNVTKFFISEMANYIRDARVWRISIRGETRSGKSEVGMTLALLYTQYFNALLESGYFDNIDIFKEGILKKNKIRFTPSFILGSQSDYIYEIRERQKNKKLNFGQIWQIDENRENIGGLGSFSEELEIKNINNIIAKFMQSEIWITPLKFLTRNAPYGILVYKKDVVNRVNWCLLYKIETVQGGGLHDFIFLGWLKVPLHKNERLRRAYNKKKNAWIQNEIAGVVDKRMQERKKVSQMLADDVLFKTLSKSGKSFMLSKEQQISILEKYIIEGKTQRWNESEMFRIVDEARMIVMRRHVDLQMKQMSEQIKDSRNGTSNGVIINE